MSRADTRTCDVCNKERSRTDISTYYIRKINDGLITKERKRICNKCEAALTRAYEAQQEIQE